MRSVLRLAGLVLAVGGLWLPATAAADQRSGQNSVVRVDVITEVQPTGWRVVAVAIEYRDRLSLGNAEIPNAAFEVTATINNTTANRTVVDVYTSDVPELDRRGQRGGPGRYVIVELDPNDPNASALEFSLSTFLNNPIPLVGAYSVRQTADIRGASGRVALRASPFAVANQGVISPIVDDFVPMTFTDSAGTRLPFRLYQPRVPSSRRRGGLPLVVFLHGAGERGTNNITQITANQGAVAFAKPERQASDRSYVLAPQAPAGQSWTTPAVQAALLELIDRIVATYPIDQDRLYLSGISMGAIGSFDILPKHPDKFAGALLVAGTGDPSRMPLMRDVPLWATHSIDDPVVNYTTGTLALINAIEASGVPVVRGEWPGNLPDRAAESQALRLWAQAEAAGSHTLLTSYTPGTTPVNAHWSWVPTYINDVMIDWLYSQDLQDRDDSGVMGFSDAALRGLAMAGR